MDDITKHKSPFPWMGTNSPAWCAIVQYITSHSDDIENSIDDFGDLMPVWEFFNRESDLSETD